VVLSQNPDAIRRLPAYDRQPSLEAADGYLLGSQYWRAADISCGATTASLIGRVSGPIHHDQNSIDKIAILAQSICGTGPRLYPDGGLNGRAFLGANTFSMPPLPSGLSPQTINHITHLFDTSKDCFELSHEEIVGAKARFLIIDALPTAAALRGAHKTWLPGAEILIMETNERMQAYAEITQVLVSHFQIGDMEPAIALALALTGVTPQELFDGPATSLKFGNIAHIRVIERASGPLISMLGKLTSREKLLVAEQLVAQTERLHNQGYAHLDLRSDNIVITLRAAGGNTIGFIDLIDFGCSMETQCVDQARNLVAQLVTASSKQVESYGSRDDPDTAIGSVMRLQQMLENSNTYYEGPEIRELLSMNLPESAETAAAAHQLLQKTDVRRSDVWSLGLIFLELVRGEEITNQLSIIHNDQQVVSLIAHIAAEKVDTSIGSSGAPISREDLTYFVKDALN